MKAAHRQSYRQNGNKPKLWVFVFRYICENSSVHGVNIIGFRNINIFERIFWLVITVLAGCAAILLLHSNYTKFQNSPTVVSLKKDFRNWLNPFPSVTGCFVNKTDLVKAEELISQLWAVNSSNSKYDYYLKFVQSVAGINYHALDNFREFENDPDFQNVDMLDIALKVHPKLSGNLVTFETKFKPDWKLLISEMGICFNVNSKFSHFLSFKYAFLPWFEYFSQNVIFSTSNDEENNSEDIPLLKCHYLNGLCYARYDSDPQKRILYYVHSYLDVVHATINPPLIVRESEELEINYRMQETIASPELRYLTPLQRRCRFDDEPIDDNLPVYSSSICFILCRYRLALKLCGCKPFFYAFLKKGKICDVKGLSCLSKYVANFTKAPAQIGCKCLQPCHMITYLPQIPKRTKWEYGYFDQRLTFRWGLISPTTKYHREVIFGFEDLVVAFGGGISLLLGMSTISAIEFWFLLFEGLYKYYQSKR